MRNSYLTMADYGWNIQAALSAPRFTIRDTGEPIKCTILIESRVAPEVQTQLRKQGHELVLLGSPLLVWSQTGLTSLRGTVTDPSGALLARAEVSLDNAATGFHVSHGTDQTGAYEFPQIPPGKYTISATKAGFAQQVKTAELLVSQPATINFALSVQATSETVEVNDIAQAVNTADATIGTRWPIQRFRRFRLKVVTCRICSACSLAWCI